MGGGKKVVIEPHRHEGVFIARGKEDALVTKNMVLGESVYGEKRIATEDEAGKLEYRVWNPFRSKLAAAILGGVDKIHMPPGSKVLYLGAASGTSVSHVSDVVGPEGMVYAVEFSHRSGRDLLNVAKKRTNLSPLSRTLVILTNTVCWSPWSTVSSLMWPSPTRPELWPSMPNISSRTEATLSSQLKPIVLILQRNLRPCLPARSRRCKRRR